VGDHGLGGARGQDVPVLGGLGVAVLDHPDAVLGLGGRRGGVVCSGVVHGGVVRGGSVMGNGALGGRGAVVGTGFPGRPVLVGAGVPRARETAGGAAGQGCGPHPGARVRLGRVLGGRVLHRLPVTSVLGGARYAVPVLGVPGAGPAVAVVLGAGLPVGEVVAHRDLAQPVLRRRDHQVQLPPRPHGGAHGLRVEVRDVVEQR